MVHGTAGATNRTQGDGHPVQLRPHWSCAAALGDTWLRGFGKAGQQNARPACCLWMSQTRKQKPSLCLGYSFNRQWSQIAYPTFTCQNDEAWEEATVTGRKLLFESTSVGEQIDIRAVNTEAGASGVSHRFYCCHRNTSWREHSGICTLDWGLTRKALLSLGEAWERGPLSPRTSTSFSLTSNQS